MIEPPFLCLIFKSNLMKRIVILSCFLLSAMAFVSCTNDEIEPSTPSATSSVLADDGDTGGTGGNSSGQTPTTPPKK